MWSIPTQGRIGCGYVYSDRFLDPEGAKAEIERALGHPIEPRNDIRFDPGRLDRVAIGNVIALGLSSAFLEPLEATSIHGTVVQLLLLAPMLMRRPPHRRRPRRLQRHRRPPGRRLPRLHQPPLRHRARRHPVLAARPRRVHRRPDARAPRRSGGARCPTAPTSSRSPAASPHVEEQLHYPVLDGLGLLDPRGGARPHGRGAGSSRAKARADRRRPDRRIPGGGAAGAAAPRLPGIAAEHEDLTA